MESNFQINEWRSLGWQNHFWELVRYYCSLRGNAKEAFLKSITDTRIIEEKWKNFLFVNEDIANKLISYLTHRHALLDNAMALLRSEEEAIEYCRLKTFTFSTTRTRNLDHHQSSKTLISTVSAIAEAICLELNETVNINPQRRCVWLDSNHLHVSARNLDGSVASLENPYIIWEIKEYWGKTKGGSKMSDAVYECQLVGKDIREYELKVKRKIHHIVFLDGLEQWTVRKSDLARFIDLHNQGLIDYLFIGKSVEQDWAPLLRELIVNKAQL